MALPAERDIEIYRGDVYEHEFTFMSGDDPLDLSTRVVTAQWRTKEDATDAVDFAVDDTGAATGVIIISLTPSQTATLGIRGVYDVQAHDGGATPTNQETLVRGTVEVTKDVTRP